MTNEQKSIVEEEVEVFKLEYPEYGSEHVEDYLKCCDNYTNTMKSYFCELLGY